jgi:putative transposase
MFFSRPYLQDILHSVKRYSARKINQMEGRDGRLWQIESYDTTIRNNQHLDVALQYTLQNPVMQNFANIGKIGKGIGVIEIKVGGVYRQKMVDAIHQT